MQIIRTHGAVQVFDPWFMTGTQVDSLGTVWYVIRIGERPEEPELIRQLDTQSPALGR